MRNWIYGLLGLLLLTSCDSSTPEFYYTQGNLKYKYHDIVEDGKSPAIGDYLTVYISYKTADGKTIYDSKEGAYDAKQIIHLGKPKVEGGIEEGFAQLMEGDSVTFYITSEKFYKYYLSSPVPQELDSEEEILITLRLLKIESPKEFEAKVKKQEEECDLKEFMLIDSITNSWSAAGELVEEINGIHLVKLNEASFDTIKYGSNVSVFYKGYYPNGKVFYSNLEAAYPDDFKVGVDGQTIEGMKIALKHLTYGQSAKIIIPSYLGYSQSAIDMGKVPACTPLIFELQVQSKQ